MEIKSLLTRSVEALGKVGKLVDGGLKTEVDVAATRWWLYEAHQNLLDALASLIAELGLRKPSSYSEFGLILVDHGLVTKDLADILIKIARNRNILAHAYRVVGLDDLLSIYKEVAQSIPSTILRLIEVLDKKGVDPPSIKEMLEENFRDSGVRVVVLFGSRARGTAKKDSDYDVAVMTDKPLQFKELNLLSERLAKIFGVSVDKVDVVDILRVSNELLYKILRDGIPLYVKNSEEYKLWVQREYIRILDEENLMDTYYRRFKRKLKSYIKI